MSPLIGFVLWLGSQLVGSQFSYTVQPKDSLVSIAARFGVDSRVIAESNGLKPLKLQPGQILTIDNRHIVPDSNGQEIVVNIPQRMLFYFKNGRLAEHYPVAAGKRGWTTPIGAFEIVSADENPTWHVPPSIQEEMRRQGKPVLTVVAPGPNNPLGRYRLTTSLPGIAIHGTNAPTSIYSLQTHGCIRLHPDDIEALFAAAGEGTSGQTIYSPVLIARIGNKIFLEVHPDVYGKGLDPERFVREILASHSLEDSVDWSAVKRVIAKHDGIARDVSVGVFSG
jgi:L,D-transpeptidase ErfK/SrfK